MAAAVPRMPAFQTPNTLELRGVQQAFDNIREGMRALDTRLGTVTQQAGQTTLMQGKGNNTADALQQQLAALRTDLNALAAASALPAAAAMQFITLDGEDGSDGAGMPAFGSEAYFATLAIYGQTTAWGSIYSQAVEALRMNRGNGFISGYPDASTLRTGYLQFQASTAPTAVTLAAENGASLTLNTSTVERLRIDATGVVNIGTSTPTPQVHIVSNASNSFALRVDSILPGSGTSNVILATNAVDADVQMFVSSVGAATKVSGISSNVNVPMVFAPFNTERMRIDTAGNVSIGGTGAARLNIFNTGTGTSLQVVNSSAGSVATTLLNLSNGTDADCNTVISQVGAASKSAAFGPGTAIPLIFQTANNERMRIDAVGNVGIGVASDSRLRVLGPGSAGGITISYLNTSVNYYDADTHHFRNGTNAEAVTINPTAYVDFQKGVLTQRPGVFGGAAVGFNFVGSAPSTPAYYKFASLPASNVGTYDHVSIIAVLNDGWGATQNRRVELVFGNRYGFACTHFVTSGLVAVNAAKIIAQQETDGSVSLYVALLATSYTTASLQVSSSIGVTLFRDPGPVGSITGSNVFDTATTQPGVALSGGYVAANLGFTTGANAPEALRMQRDGAYVSAWNSANTVRTGYLQFNSGSTVVLAAESGAALTFNTSGGERMRVDAAGLVSVGSPGSAQFNVSKTTNATTLQAVNTSSGSGSTLVMNASNAADADFNVLISQVGAATKFAMIGPSTGVPLIFQTANTERMRIDTAGNVGIGASTFGTSAQRVLGLANAAVPTSSPAGMGQLYVDAGALKYRGSAGTVTTLAAA